MASGQLNLGNAAKDAFATAGTLKTIWLGIYTFKEVYIYGRYICQKQISKFSRTDFELYESDLSKMRSARTIASMRCSAPAQRRYAIQDSIKGFQGVRRRFGVLWGLSEANELMIL